MQGQAKGQDKVKYIFYISNNISSAAKHIVTMNPLDGQLLTDWLNELLKSKEMPGARLKVLFQFARLVIFQESLVSAVTDRD